MRKLLFLLMSFTCSCYVQAQNALTVTKKSGGDVCYAFSEKPKVTFPDNVIRIVTTREVVEIQMSEVQHFTFTDVEDAIEVITSNRIVEDGIRIYNLNGVLVNTIKPQDGNVSISISSLPAGTYIIKEGNYTYKLLKK